MLHGGGASGDERRRPVERQRAVLGLVDAAVVGRRGPRAHPRRGDGFSVDVLRTADGVGAAELRRVGCIGWVRQVGVHREGHGGVVAVLERLADERGVHGVHPVDAVRVEGGAGLERVVQPGPRAGPDGWRQVLRPGRQHHVGSPREAGQRRRGRTGAGEEGRPRARAREEYADGDARSR